MPTIPRIVTVSPSGSTPVDGMVSVTDSPAVTEPEKLRAIGAWLGVARVGRGLTVTVRRPVLARSGAPSAYAAYSMTTSLGAVRPGELGDVADEVARREGAGLAAADDLDAAGVEHQRDAVGHRVVVEHRDRDAVALAHGGAVVLDRR